MIAYHSPLWEFFPFSDKKRYYDYPTTDDEGHSPLWGFFLFSDDAYLDDLEGALDAGVTVPSGDFSLF